MGKAIDRLGGSPTVVVSSLARPRCRALYEALAFVAFLWLVSLARYDLSVSVPNYAGVAVCSVIGGTIVFVGSAWLRLRGSFAAASSDELVFVVCVTGVACVVIYFVVGFAGSPRLVPLSAPVSAAALTVLASGLLTWAGLNLRYRRQLQREHVKNALVIGAGVRGMRALRMIRDDARQGLVAVGFLDDDPQKRHLRIDGIRVLGCLDDMPEVIAAHNVRTLILALPAFASERREKILDTAIAQNVEVKVVPEFDAIDVRHRQATSPGSIDLRPGSFRSVAIDDLIGRRQISTHLDSIASYIEGKTVLVTGAGGSIGSVLCSQISRHSPQRLVMTDRDESGLYATQLVLEGEALLTNENLVLGDLQDEGFVHSLIQGVQPNIIFHAAALKHLTLLERFPEEAIKTNIGCSLRLLEEANQAGVESFVHVSTDKAADPISVLGATKYVTERIVAAIAQQTQRRYVSVRFGNVLGSRGSVLGTFVTQVAAGGPVTLTAPGVTRYFMTAPEACDLVLQAGAIGKPGETLVLDMGEPVIIKDLAQRVIRLSGQEGIAIKYSGLRPGEKLHEVRLAANELDLRPTHPLITQVPIIPIPIDPIRELLNIAQDRCSRLHRSELRDSLMRTVNLPNSTVDSHSGKLL